METVKTDTPQLIKERLSYILSSFGLSATIDSHMEGNVLKVNVTTDNDELFIGRTADPLLALQHLLRVMFKAELSQDEASLVLNIGDFQNQQKLALETVAKQAIDEVVQNQHAFYLRPMSSYERRIVHMVLADHPEVMSESEGEGAARRIVVRPK